MQRLEVSGAVRHIYASLGVKGLIKHKFNFNSTSEWQGEGKEWQKETWKTRKVNWNG